MTLTGFLGIFFIVALAVVVLCLVIKLNQGSSGDNSFKNSKNILSHETIKNDDTTDSHICSRCSHVVDADHYLSEYKLCFQCMNEISYATDELLQSIPTLQKRANEATSINEKIACLKVMLDYIYNYKINYADRGFNFVEQNLDDLISQVLESVSYIREDETT